ncbi:MAG: alpha/beta hydrolase-fold protein [Nocardioides sp.]
MAESLARRRATDLPDFLKARMEYAAMQFPRHSTRHAALLAAALLASGQPARAQAAEAKTPPAAILAQIPRSEQIDLVSPSNGSFRIMISAPRGKAPPQGYPVVYLLDGNSVFGTMTEAVRMQEGRIGPAVIVAIGYPIDTALDGPRRFYDLTEVTDPKNLPEQTGRDRRTGGRETFLDFLIGQVKPLVESKYPIDQNSSTLFGHSLGGYFVLHTLFSRPEAFHKYVAASPSIWWNGHSLVTERKSYIEKRRGHEKRNELMVIVGAEELGYMVNDARDIVRTLAPMRVYHKEIAGEDHVSVLPPALNAALHFALDPR